VACGPAGAARGREGADAAERRAGAPAAGAALGPDGQGVPLRHRQRHGVPRRSLQRTVAAPRLPLHVRARVHGGMSVLLGNRGWLRRLRRPPRESRRHALRGVAGSARETAGVQAANGLELPLGVVVRQRLQLRLQHGAHQGAAAVGSRRLQLPRDRRGPTGGRRGESGVRPDRVERRNGLADVHARGARRERVRAGGWRRLPHLLGLRSRAGRPLGHVPVARPRATRSQRDRLLVAPPRQVRQTACGGGELGA
jgi:hypothetical protein